MPPKSEKQRRFMGAELGRLRAGKPTRTHMSETQLEEYASEPVEQEPKRKRPDMSRRKR